MHRCVTARTRIPQQTASHTRHRTEGAESRGSLPTPAARRRPSPAPSPLSHPPPQPPLQRMGWSTRKPEAAAVSEHLHLRRGTEKAALGPAQPGVSSKPPLPVRGPRPSARPSGATSVRACVSFAGHRCRARVKSLAFVPWFQRLCSPRNAVHGVSFNLL